MSPERSIGSPQNSASTIEGPYEAAKNKRLRQGSATSSSEKPGLDLLTLSDPDRDDKVCEAMHHIRSLIWVFAGDLLHTLDPRQTSQALNVWLSDVNFGPTFRYVGMLAMGGPLGEKGWDIMLADRQCLQALVLGVLGRALKEHVFGALWFGGSEKEIKQLEALEIKGAEMDGMSSSPQCLSSSSAAD